MVRKTEFKVCVYLQSRKMTTLFFNILSDLSGSRAAGKSPFQLSIVTRLALAYNRRECSALSSSPLV